MAKSIIVYRRDLKQMGKYAERIKKHLGMRLCVGWGAGRSSFKLPAKNTVVFFEWALSEVPQIKNGHKAISFAEVAKQINDAIALTEYHVFPIKPSTPGVYKCSKYSYAYFDGAQWGNSDNTPESAVDLFNRWRTAGAIQGKTWRGLSEEPILVKP